MENGLTKNSTFIKVLGNSSIPSGLLLHIWRSQHGRRSSVFVKRFLLRLVYHSLFDLESVPGVKSFIPRAVRFQID